MLIGLVGKEARYVSSLIMDVEEDSISIRFDFNYYMFGKSDPSVAIEIFTAIYNVLKDTHKYIIFEETFPESDYDSDFIIKLGGKVLNVGDDVWSKFEIELFLKGLEAC